MDNQVRKMVDDYKEHERNMETYRKEADEVRKELGLSDITPIPPNIERYLRNKYGV